MFYYKFHIGDYQSHTRHLTIREHISYRFLLDLYYLQEKPLVNDIKKLAKLLTIPDYEKDIKAVLEEFFTLTDSGWANKRADLEIESYKKKLFIASKAGKKSARVRKEKVNKQTGEIVGGL
jgi:uncharacterized protein YdaU (DUF1376 family)